MLTPRTTKSSKQRLLRCMFSFVDVEAPIQLAFIGTCGCKKVRVILRSLQALDDNGDALPG